MDAVFLLAHMFDPDKFCAVSPNLSDSIKLADGTSEGRATVDQIEFNTHQQVPSIYIFLFSLNSLQIIVT